MNRPPSFVWSKLALISVSSAYSTKAEPKKRRFCCCPCLPVLGWLWRLICWAFGETGRKAALYCRFLFVPSLFLFSLRLSVSVCLSWPTVPRFWLSGSGSISAALLGLAVCWRSCLCCRRAGSGSPVVPLLALISGRLCRWCCLRLFVRVRFWGWRFVRSGAVWACPGVPVSSAAALLVLALGGDAGQKDMAECTILQVCICMI